MAQARQYSCRTHTWRSVTSSSSVLIVDDKPAVRDLLSRWVTALGLHATTATNADEALAILRAGRYDLAVVDGLMPGHEGLWLATELQREHPYTGVIIATGYTDLLGADAPQPEIADLTLEPSRHDGFAWAIERGRQWRKQALEELQWHAALSRELRERTEDLCVRLHASADQSRAIIYQLTAVMAERVPAMLQHGARVARFAVATAREMSLDRKAIDELDLAARLHDVGKAAMPDALLTKPSPLGPGETAIMRRHVEAGAEILRRAPALASIAPIVLTTHEWFGGGGYPLKLAGAAIPLASRIIGVVDAYDTMTDAGRDRASAEPAGAVSELLRCGGTQFDPEALAAFLSVLGRH
jgi:putative nucleotidyltransferase with HDIG domain